MAIVTYSVDVELTRDGADAWYADTEIVGQPDSKDSFDFAGHPSEQTAYRAAAQFALARYMAKKGKRGAVSDGLSDQQTRAW